MGTATGFRQKIQQQRGHPFWLRCFVPFSPLCKSPIESAIVPSRWAKFNAVPSARDVGCYLSGQPSASECTLGVNFGTNCSFTERRRCFSYSVARCFQRNLCSLLFDDATSSRCLSIDLSLVKLFHASCKPIVGNLFARKCSSEEERSSEANNLEVKIYRFDYHVDS